MAKLKVQEQDEEWYGCTATIISRNYVLTAAHCIKKMKEAFVYLGSANIDTAQEHKISNSIWHSGYNNATDVNDIGLVKVSKS